MEERNLLERLTAISPGMEIWWDSSPLVFESFCRKALAKAKPRDRDVLARQVQPHVRPQRARPSSCSGV